MRNVRSHFCWWSYKFGKEVRILMISNLGYAIVWCLIYVLSEFLVVFITWVLKSQEHLRNRSFLLIIREIYLTVIIIIKINIFCLRKCSPHFWIQINSFMEYPITSFIDSLSNGLSTACYIWLRLKSFYIISILKLYYYD